MPDMDVQLSLLAAIKQGNLLEVGKALALKANPNEPAEDGLTPIQHAVTQGSESVALLLLKSGADINQLIYYALDYSYRINRTLLHWSLDKKFSKLIYYILTTGFSLKNICTDNGLSIQKVSIELDDDNVFEWLLKQGEFTNKLEQDGMNCLHYAVLRKAKNIAYQLLSKGKAIDIHCPNILGQTALDIAIEQKYNEQKGIIELLLSFGAKIKKEVNYSFNGNMRYKVNALEWAIETNQPENVCLSLLKDGVKFDFLDSQGNTVLANFAIKGYYQAVLYLLQVNKVDINEMGAFGQTALHMLANIGHIKEIEFLLKNGANLDLVDYRGYTPANYAIFENQYGFIQYMIDNNFKLDGKYRFKSTHDQNIVYYNRPVLSWMMYKDKIDLAYHYLFSSTADTIDVDNELLLWACKHVYEKLIWLILERGYLVNLIDNNGQSFLEILKKSNKNLADNILKKFDEIAQNLFGMDKKDIELFLSQVDIIPKKRMDEIAIRYHKIFFEGVKMVRFFSPILERTLSIVDQLQDHKKELESPVEVIDSSELYAIVNVLPMFNKFVENQQSKIFLLEQQRSSKLPGNIEKEKTKVKFNEN